MDPGAWRKRENLSLRALALQLGIKAPMTVKRYETGERDVPNRIVLAYARISNDEVTAQDFERARRRFLRKAENAQAA